MEALFERQNRLLALTSEAFVRQMMKDINWDARLIAIRGARGVGKTTLMLQYIKSHYSAGSRSALYCSLDSLYFTEHRLVDLAELFYKAGGKHLFLDEVHKYPSWSREVKEIYDIYPDLRIVVSGSSLLNIIHGDADLSRRCVAYSMQGLSFREFLAFFHNINIPVHPLEDVLEHATGLCAQVNAVCRPLPLFKDYLQHGYYPYYKENQHDYFTTIEQVASFVIESELPQLCGVEASNTRKIKALLGIIATSVPFEVDISKLSTVIGVHRNTTLEYLGDLGKAGLLCLDITRKIPDAQVSFGLIDQIIGTVDVLINATPVGMYPKCDEQPIHNCAIGRCANVFDAIYNPYETALVKRAKANGSRAEGGMSMLVWQAVVAHEHWDGSTYEKADIDRLCEDAAKELMGR